MVQKSSPGSPSTSPRGAAHQLSGLIRQLEADTELRNDLRELQELGLTAEELAGYRDFFIENYYIKPLWRVQNEH